MLFNFNEFNFEFKSLPVASGYCTGQPSSGVETKPPPCLQPLPTCLGLLSRADGMVLNKDPTGGILRSFFPTPLDSQQADPRRRRSLPPGDS